ncbi:MAG TPA: hypothetical protein VJ302_35970, partial [Blastocatellia bacterium]|nr:hypothetical protein [Blastocatellia bacterium]
PLQLTIGEVTEAVVVMGRQEVIETSSADRGLVFEPVKVQELPLNGRQVFMLLSLTPGVLFTQEQFGAGGFSGTRGWDVNNSLRINGARAGQNLFLLNGAPISNQDGTWQVAPNAEAVQEFKVMTNTYDAAYGRFGGGVVNVTLKSGGNQWHGQSFEFWRNRIFDANSFQANFANREKNFHNQHQFGAVVGGPIRRDKDFIFGSFEGWQEVVPFPNLASVPPLDLRDGKNFTKYGIKVYDSTTTHECGTQPGDPTDCRGQVYVRNQFLNNEIPADRISPIGRKILSYYPAPNTPGTNDGLSNNFVGPNVGRYYYNQPMVRWDHVFNETDRLHAVWMYQHGYEYRDSTGFGRPAGNGNTDNQRRFQSYLVSWTHVISPSAVLDTRVSFMRFTQITPGYSDFTLTPESLGMTELAKSPSNPYNVVPQMNVDGYTRLFSSGSALFRAPFSQGNLAPSLTLTRSRHTIHTGFEFNYQARGDLDTGNTNFTFGTGWTQQFPSQRFGSLDGNGVAALLLGTPTGGGIANNASYYRTRPYYAGYVQDDWRVATNLHLNLGLRYEVQVPWKERFNRTNRGFDPSAKHPLSDQIIAAWARTKADYDSRTPTPKYPYPSPPTAIYGTFEFPGVDGEPERVYDTDYTNLAPRLGVAWRIAKNTVIRTGGGIYYQSTTQFNTTTGFSQGTGYTATNLQNPLIPSAGLTGPFSLVNPFPGGLIAPPGASPLAGIAGGISFDPPRFKVPRTYQFTFGFQQQLGRELSAEVSYAGNIQTYINMSQDYNHPGLVNQQLAIADPSYYDRQLPNPFKGLLPNTLALNSTDLIGAFDLLRPFPLYRGGVTNNLVQAGRYRADLLQIGLNQRDLGGDRSLGGTLTWSFSYTLSKTYEANHRLNNWNTQEPLIHEIDFQDKTHTLSFSGVWDVPLGQKRRFLNSNRLAGAILGNWRLSWIFSYGSGYPATWPNLINKCGVWQASYNGGVQGEDRWFNNDKSCYQQLPNNVLRTLPDRFSDIRQPQAPQLNGALEKTFHLSETKRLQFRAEGFNLTNTPIRGGVVTDFNSADFGKLPKSQLNFPRFFQIAGKFYF